MNFLKCINLNIDTNENITILNDINVNLCRNEIFGIVGKKGSCKYSFINIVSILSKSSNETTYIDGVDVFQDRDRIKKITGIVKNTSFYKNLSARENLEFFCGLQGIPSRLHRERIEDVLDVVGLLEYRDKFVSDFSELMLKKLDIARAILHNPKLLVIHKPTNGLAKIEAKEIIDIILNLNEQGKTILLSTENWDEADTICDKVSIINNGKIIATGNPEYLKSKLGNNVYELHISRKSMLDKNLIFENLFENSEFLYSDVDSDTICVKIITEEKYSFDYLNEVIDSIKIKILKISLSQLSLEDVFMVTVNNS